MKIHDHVSSHHSFMYLWIVGAVLVLGGLVYSYIGSHPTGIIDGEHEGDVRTTAAQFGNALKSVSLFSPTAAEEIRHAYSPYVTEELLALWMQNPSSAPGRMASSPWPDHIELDSVVRNEAGSYDVSGRIILKTSTEDAGSIPVSLTVANVNGSFLITHYKENPGSSPTEASTVEPSSVTARLGETVSIFNITLTPLEIIEDSRCPSDVQCIQAGRFRALVEIKTNGGEYRETLTLGSDATFDGETVMVILREVTPYPVVDSPIKVTDYLLKFEVETRRTE